VWCRRTDDIVGTFEGQEEGSQRGKAGQGEEILFHSPLANQFILRVLFV